MKDERVIKKKGTRAFLRIQQATTQQKQAAQRAELLRLAGVLFQGADAVEAAAKGGKSIIEQARSALLYIGGIGATLALGAAGDCIVSGGGRKKVVALGLAMDRTGCYAELQRSFGGQVTGHPTITECRYVVIKKGDEDDDGVAEWAVSIKKDTAKSGFRTSGMVRDHFSTLGQYDEVFCQWVKGAAGEMYMVVHIGAMSVNVVVSDSDSDEDCGMVPSSSGPPASMRLKDKSATILLKDRVRKGKSATTAPRGQSRQQQLAELTVKVV